VTKKPRAARRSRVLKARPLLVAVGAAALLAGCGDDTTTVTGADFGLVPHFADMGKPAQPPDLTPPKD
jgi:hypothetical protein